MSNSVLVDLYHVSVPCNAMLDTAPMKTKHIPDNKIHGANMGPTWVLSSPDGPMLAPWTLLSGIYCNIWMTCLLWLTPFLDLEREWQKQIKRNDSCQCVIVLPNGKYDLNYKSVIFIFTVINILHISCEIPYKWMPQGVGDSELILTRVMVRAVRQHAITYASIGHCHRHHIGSLVMNTKIVPEWALCQRMKFKKQSLYCHSWYHIQNKTM